MNANASVLSRRPYGPDAIPLSIIGMGGVVVMNEQQEHANRVVAEFVERGVNYFDVSPTYGDAEIRLGPALKPYRKDVFLACKTGQRTREGSLNELENSLKTLHTDHFDLYQLHAVTEVGKDIDAVFAKGGAMETLIEAKKEGRVRYLGFSAHSVEAAVAAMDRFAFDSILFPVNFAMYEKGNFGPQIMEKAQAKGLTRLALKAMALQKWSSDDAPGRKRFPKCWYEPIADLELASPALRFTLSQPVTAAIPPGEESLFRLALMIALRYTPITPEEVEDLKGIAAKLAPPFEAVG